MFDEIAYKKAYRHKHRERLNSLGRIYWRKNKDRQNERKKLYYQNHPEKLKDLRVARSEWAKSNQKRLRVIQRKWTDRVKASSKFRWLRGRSLAKFRDLEWSLTLEEYTILISRPCEYCNGVLPKYGVGLDRIHSSRGYIRENVVPCCTPCNRIKNNILSFDEMKVAMKAVKEFRLKKILLGVL